jgi:multiple sugar transport system permease protein
MHINKNQIKINRILIYIFLSIGAVICIVPFYWMIITSIKIPSEVIAYPPKWWPSRFAFGNFATIFKRADFFRYFYNSIVVALFSIPLCLFTSSFAGFLFAKYNFRLKEFWFMLILSTMMIPFAVIMIPLYIEMSYLNLIDKHLGMILRWAVNPFGIFLMRQFIGQIPNSLMDSARIDGCSEFKIFTKIIVPNVKPAISALGIFVFRWNWDDFLWPLIITNSSYSRTLPVGVAMFAEQWWTEYNLTMAGAVIIVIPILIVFLLFQRQFIKGIVLTGLKG